jgi:hypothetical protein
MYATTADAKRAAHSTLLLKQQAQGRKVSPWVQRAMAARLPAKELAR